MTDPPPAYTMCSRQECLSREETNEVSFFEATAESVQRYAVLPSKWRIDPRLAVKKYRRSAAGGGSNQQEGHRSLDDLSTTVDYLIQIFVSQQPWRQVQDGSPSQSLLKAVGFIEDRIRAVQVDLVQMQPHRSEDAPRLCSLQLRLVRVHILILYLTIDATPQQYARKFGKDALTTALAAFWQSSYVLLDQDKSSPFSSLDQVLGLETVLGIAKHFEAISNKNHSSQPLLAPSVVVHLRRIPWLASSHLPLFQWTLALASQLQAGHWRTALDTICRGGRELMGQDCWHVLVRAILAQVIPLWRHHALRVYNACFLKSPGITGDQLAKLLCIGDDDDCTSDGTSAKMTAAQNALGFARQYGLLVEEDEKTSSQVVRFKVVSVEAYFPPKRLRQDSCCLQLGQNSSQRVDSDGIRVPMASFLKGIIEDNARSLDALTNRSAVVATNPKVPSSPPSSLQIALQGR